MANNTNNIPVPQVILENENGGMSQPWYLYFASQGLIVGTGVPAAGVGAPGNFYFRRDPAGALTYIYFKNQNTGWGGIV